MEGPNAKPNGMEFRWASSVNLFLDDLQSANLARRRRNSNVIGACPLFREIEHDGIFSRRFFPAARHITFATKLVEVNLSGVGSRAWRFVSPRNFAFADAIKNPELIGWPQIRM